MMNIANPIGFNKNVINFEKLTLNTRNNIKFETHSSRDYYYKYVCNYLVQIENDDNFFAGGNFLCIHADSDGNKTICLPRRTDAVEIYTGEVLGRDTDCLEFPMKAFETKVIFLGEAEKIRARLGFK